MLQNIENNFLNCIFFSTGDTHIIMEQRHISSMVSAHTAYNLPNGKADAAIIAIEELLGLELLDDRLQNRRVLTINTAGKKLLLEVNEPVELIDFAYNKIHPLPVLLKSKINLPYIRAIAVVKKGIGLVIDPMKII